MFYAKEKVRAFYAYAAAERPLQSARSDSAFPPRGFFTSGALGTAPGRPRRRLSARRYHLTGRGERREAASFFPGATAERGFLEDGMLLVRLSASRTPPRVRPLPLLPPPLLRGKWERRGTSPAPAR